jgi:hypothetical protein
VDVQRAFKAISGHGIFPILIAVGIAVTGHSAMLIRSTVLMICAAWLSVDVGIWVSNTKWKLFWKVGTVVLSCCLSFCIVMCIMYVFLESNLEDQQTDVAKNLIVTMELPSSGLPYQTADTVINNSETDIDHFQIACIANTMQSANYILVEGFEFIRTRPKIFNEVLKKNGKGVTDYCLLDVLDKSTKMMCLDITVQVDYSLATQPLIPQRKSYRFVMRDGGKWQQQPEDTIYSYCTGNLIAPDSSQPKK